VKGPNPLHLKQSLESLVSQTYDSIEVIVIFDEEGKSLDAENLSVFEQFRDDHRVKVFRRKAGRGLCSALNDAIKLCKGNFIARMDADDVSCPDRIEKQVYSIKKRRLSVIGTWAYLTNEDCKVIGQLSHPTEPEDIRRVIMLHNPIVHGSILFPRELIKEVGLFNSAFYGAEDYDFYLRCIAAGKQLGNLGEPLLYLRETKGSITRGKNMMQSRTNYFKTKINASFKYGFRTPLDLTYLCISPFIFLIPPGKTKNVKSLLGWFSYNQQPVNYV